MNEAIVDTNAQTPAVEGGCTACVGNEHDAAFTLFRLIAQTENWWQRKDGMPSRDEILACYANCVAAARGESPAPEAGSSPLPDRLKIMIEAMADPDVAAESPGQQAAAYGAVQELAEPDDPIDEPNLITVTQDGVSFEA